MDIPGVVKIIIAEKNYGFVRGDDGLEFFFHRSALQDGVSLDDLRPGQRITFTADPRVIVKGPRAVTVRIDTKETR